MNHGNEQSFIDPLKDGVITGEKGKYKLIRELGSGNFGTTYLAEDLSNNHSKYAIKKFKDTFNKQSSANKVRKNFENESDVLQEITHPQVPKMIESFTYNLSGYQGMSRFLVQEYIEGETLEVEFKNNEEWGQKEVIDFLVDILGILKKIQEDYNLIHRDIKPANLMRRTQDGKICLIDFGLVKLINLNYSRDLLTAKTWGTPYYMAPEQLNGKVNFCTDIYSVGLVAIEGLTGYFPVVDSRKTGEVEWGNKRSEINEKVCKILEKMVSPEPKDRYQSATEVLTDLEPFTMLGKTLKNNTYIIKEYLGTDRFGNTYLAENRKGSPTYSCVIKQRKLGNYENVNLQNARENFKVEVAYLEILGSDDRIPKLLDSFETSGENDISDRSAFYLVQEYIKGEDICQELSQNNWNQNQVIDFLNQLLEILEFVHSKNVIHCDIKPSNIMRRFSDGKFVLIDFSSVKKAVSFSENVSHSSSSTQLVETIGYMSPEQPRRNEQIGFNSDIYALGITAIQALKGKEPNQLGTRDEENGKYNWSDNIQIDNKLVKILDRMVSSQPEELYQSAAQILRDMEPLKMLGKTLKNNTYIIKEYLGSGRFGNTYLAENRKSRQTYPCVIKQLKLENYNDLAIEKIKYEVAALTLLGSHNRIPKLRDSFEASGENYISDQSAFYLVQEHIEGEDIRQELSQKSWSKDQVIDFLKQLLEILKFIHSNNVIHCDIKPSNIIRRSDGNFVLIDFGSVKKAVSFSENVSHSSSSTQSVGTKHYMSPEQAQGNKQIGFNSDIYALGITAIQALTGKEPNQLGEWDSLTGKYNWSDNIQVDKKLVKILDKMVDVDPVERRYKSAQEVLNDLGKLDGKNIFDFQSLIKRKFWMAGIIFGAIVLSMLSWSILVDLNLKKNYKQGFKLQQDAEKLKRRGYAQEANETYIQALQYYNRAIEIDSKNPETWINKGYIYSQLGKPKDSQDSCKNALNTAINPENSVIQAEAYNCIAVSFQQQKDYEKATENHNQARAKYQEVYEEYSRNSSNTREILLLYAKALFNQSDTFLKWGSSIEEKGNNLVNNQAAQKKYQEAETALMEALEKMEKNPQIEENNYLKGEFRKNLGEVLLRQGRVLKKLGKDARYSFKESEKYYSQAFKLINNNDHPLKAVILLGRARVHRELKNFKGALEDCEKVLQLERVSLELESRAWICRVDINEKLGNYKSSSIYKGDAINTLKETLNKCESNKTSCENLKKLQSYLEKNKFDVW